MSEKDAAAFQEDIKDETEIFCMVEDDDANIDSQPPTKLENPRFFKPFEMFVRMYGLPGYHEFDPTIYLTLTYAFIFGIMFGDFGQGLCLLIGGFLLYKCIITPIYFSVSYSNRLFSVHPMCEFEYVQKNV